MSSNSRQSTTTVNTIIVGGGAVGLSLAYHLARRGISDVLLLERHQLTSGTSWHAAGIVGPLRASYSMTRLAMAAGELFPTLEKETDRSIGYRETGGYWLARRDERMDEMHRIASLGKCVGLQPHMIDVAELESKLPALDGQGVCGVMAVPEDASVNPVDLCMAYAAAAREGGVHIRENTPVVQLLHKDNHISGVRLADGSIIHASQVALCAGAWSRQLLESLPVPVALPLQAVEHMYVVTEPDPRFEQFPVVRDLDCGVYIKGDANKLIIGGFEPDAKCVDVNNPAIDQPFVEYPEDWQQFEPFMQAALELIPALADVGIQHFMNGPESFTVDTRPLVGETPLIDGLFVAAGMNSVGVMSSAGIGRLLSDWMIEGQPTEDVWEIDLARADILASSESHLKERMREAVADQFAMHWPFKQAVAGRDLRRSVLHQHWQKHAAVFGVTAGWERPLWFARTAAESKLPYSVAAQPWQKIIEHEVAALEQGVCLLELSPFSKFDITGSDALAALDFLSSASLDVACGRIVYTQLLNNNGGIEADVTITRIATDHFRVLSGAATRWRDHAYLRRQLCQANRSVVINDVTEDYSVIGIMGAAAHQLVLSMLPPSPAHQSQNNQSQNNQSEADTLALFGSIQTTMLNIPCRLSRLSFIGEFGYEVEVDVDRASELLDHLLKGGAQPMGLYALESCRLEKAYRHWGHELGPMINPLEAGIGFTIDKNKKTIATAALEKFSTSLPTATSVSGAVKNGQRLFLCEVEPDPAGQLLLLHDEPVWQGERVVGMTTSGALGARTGKFLSFVLLDSDYQWSLTEPFRIEVAGAFHEARVLTHAPFDPQNLRMRVPEAEISN